MRLSDFQSSYKGIKFVAKISQRFILVSREVERFVDGYDTNEMIF